MPGRNVNQNGVVQSNVERILLCVKANAISSAVFDFVKPKIRIKYTRSSYWDSKSKDGKETVFGSLVLAWVDKLTMYIVNRFELSASFIFLLLYCVEYLVQRKLYSS